jgi:hypothetical protein
LEIQNHYQFRNVIAFIRESLLLITSLAHRESLKTINHRDTETQRKTKKDLLISKKFQSFRAWLRQAIVVPSSSFGGGAAPPLAFPSPARRGKGKQTASPAESFMALFMNRSELGF